MSYTVDYFDAVDKNQEKEEYKYNENDFIQSYDPEERIFPWTSDKDIKKTSWMSLSK